VRAALGWFVLHELAGLDGVRNYAGSWEEWGNRDDLPFASDVPPTTAVAPAPAATPEQPS
jgi:thiosulfate/3-mercaptopyruvate sulfurtransferase